MLSTPPWTTMHQLKLNLKLMLLLLTNHGSPMQLKNLSKLKIDCTSSFIQNRINLKKKQSLGTLKLTETILSQSLEWVRRIIFKKVLTKMQNDLKRPEMTYNGQETTWNDLQRARNDLKRPTTSKKQSEMIHKE